MINPKDIILMHVLPSVLVFILNLLLIKLIKKSGKSKTDTIFLSVGLILGYSLHSWQKNLWLSASAKGPDFIVWALLAIAIILIIFYRNHWLSTIAILIVSLLGTCLALKGFHGVYLETYKLPKMIIILALSLIFLLLFIFGLRKAQATMAGTTFAIYLIVVEMLFGGLILFGYYSITVAQILGIAIGLTIASAVAKFICFKAVNFSSSFVLVAGFWLGAITIYRFYGTDDLIYLSLVLALISPISVFFINLINFKSNKAKDLIIFADTVIMLAIAIALAKFLS